MNRTSMIVAVATLVIIGASLTINQYDLLQDSTTPIRSSILEARFYYGRWPRDWHEVENAIEKSFGYTPPTHTFESILILPNGKWQCRVISRGRNLLGFRYEVNDILIWNDEEERTWRLRFEHKVDPRVMLPSSSK